MADLRYGFTTGSCATAAAKAALYMLLSGRELSNISISTPSGIDYNPEIIDIKKGDDYVSCAVIKDSGDDPDVTKGAQIVARVEAAEEDELSIVIDGGEGVGRVTKKGLSINVGEAAINATPRQMIKDELTKVAELFDFKGKINVIISVPDGEIIAKRTFNERLGILGGISIIGTTGIVEPMSEKALLDSIYVELAQKRECEGDSIIIAPGNYGRDFLREHFGYDIEKCVKCSNYIGDTLLMIKKLGFKRVLLIGHIGKLVKLSGGIMNTHSKNADARMELLCACAVLSGADTETLREILKCINTTQALEVLTVSNIKKQTMEILMDKIMENLNRICTDLEIECIMYSENEVLAVSENAMELINR